MLTTDSPATSRDTAPDDEAWPAPATGTVRHGPRVDAVIVAYRSAADLPACITALRDQPEIGRIVVIDHGDDGSADVARRAGADTVVTDPTNPGFGAGQNRGVALTDAPFVLLCNPDARLRPGALAAGLRVLDADPGLAAVQGIVEGAGGTDRSAGRELGPLHLWGRALGLRGLLGRPLVRRLAAASPLADAAHRVPARPTDVDTLAATAPLVRRAAFDDVGGFDPSYFLYGEDLDWCRRLRRGGWRLRTLPLAWAIHREGSSSQNTVGRERAWWNGTLSFAARWWEPRAWVGAVAAGVVAAVRHGRGHPARTRTNLAVMVGEPLRRRRAADRRV